MRLCHKSRCPGLFYNVFCDQNMEITYLTIKMDLIGAPNLFSNGLHMGRQTTDPIANPAHHSH